MCRRYICLVSVTNRLYQKVRSVEGQWFFLRQGHTRLDDAAYHRTFLSARVDVPEHQPHMPVAGTLIARVPSVIHGFARDE